MIRLATALLLTTSPLARKSSMALQPCLSAKAKSQVPPSLCKVHQAQHWQVALT